MARFMSFVLLFAPLMASAARADTPPPPNTGAIAADCAVGEKPWAVGSLLNTLPGSEEEARAARHVAPAFEICGGKLTIDQRSQSLSNGRAYLAAAMAERLLDKRGANLSNVSAEPWYASAIGARKSTQGYDATSIGMQAFGTCVVHAAPDASVALLRSSEGSAEERAAVRGIKPILAGCLYDGAPVHISFIQLRLMIAEPLYHVLTDGRSAGRS